MEIHTWTLAVLEANVRATRCFIQTTRGRVPRTQKLSSLWWELRAVKRFPPRSKPGVGQTVTLHAACAC